MRYAILSDVHGNLEALTAVLRDAADHADAFVCLGDIVGYGADPGPCVDLVGRHCDVVVAGNHDYAVAGKLDPAWFTRYARAAAEWTATELPPSTQAWLGTRPLTSEVGDATLVHASPLRPEEWDYLITPDDGFAAFAAFTTRLCFVGHSHMPGVWSLGSSGPDYAAGAVDFQLENGRRYIINVGSIGQPRDRDPRAAYAVWDVEARRIFVRRVTYDAAEARRKIQAAGLPAFLGDRLAAGT
ncbi:MAG: metallophosphoesterase family protein [Candidatus Rokubacteria bacterium]|nr:metallophosphoesterase family protein [Candidatus Rokubacteria bacterium]